MKQKAFKDEMLRQQEEADVRLRNLSIEKEANRIRRQEEEAERDLQRKQLRERVAAEDMAHR